ncbi:unnamed protein product [Strongylus vulgaris]|uniref:DUF7802 domain-containing protein n=1 Tax=Strongylus vulgaris TaxID=40348 RepID=A0A3P7K1S8_STRVU|nr:unnamed protein product [Strongylus vulgaris]
MRLPWWAEGPAVGLSSVMLQLPFRMLGTKMLWWTWHDTDPTIRERMFWTPWSSLYFYAACACSFVWILRFTRNLLLEREYDWTKFIREFICAFLTGVLSFWLGTVQFSLLYYPLHDFFKIHSEITTIIFFAIYASLVFIADRNNVDVEARNEREYDWTKFIREFICAFLTGVLSFWLGTVQFSLLYYPLHDFFKIHSEITTIIFFAIYASLVFIADRNNVDVEARNGTRYWFDELSCAIALEYIFLMVLVVVADPLNIVSEGIHQPIGPCKEMESIHTPAGLILQREKFLCAKKYNEKYFDFHCIPNGIPQQQDDGTGRLLPLEYYAICGTDFKNRAEYTTIIWSCCIIFATFFYQMAACSGPTPVDPIKVCLMSIYLVNSFVYEFLRS